MNFIIDNWYLFLLALASAAGLFWPLLRGGAMGSISTADAVQLMNREKAVVVDVRSAAEFASGSIPGAKNVELADLDNKLASVVKSKDTPIVMICATGNRSQGAARTAKRGGYARAQSMAGGMSAWRAANMPVAKA